MPRWPSSNCSWIARCWRCEIASNQVWTRIRTFGLASRHRRPAFPLASNASKAHQTRGLLTPNIDAVSTKNMPDLTDAVDSVIGAMNSTYMFDQGSVAKTAGTKPASFGLAVPTRGNEATFPIALQRLADELDCETIPLFIDESDHFRRCGSSSDAKKADAAFNNSLVSRSS